MIVNKIRPKQKRSLNLEVLEGRLTLSTGLALAAPHTHALVRSLAQHKIVATFRGHTSFNGSTPVIPDLTGRVGNDSFTGNGSATVAGNVLQGGDVFLGNSQGSLHLQLGTAVGKHPRQKIPIVVVEATGKYAQLTGLTGILTKYNVPARPGAISTFSGNLNIP
jgi:hypothetical protein